MSALRVMSSDLSRWLGESGVPITRLVNKKRREVCMVIFQCYVGGNEMEFLRVRVCVGLCMGKRRWILFCSVEFVFERGSVCVHTNISK